MDIKNALNAVLPIQSRVKDPVERTIKSDNTTEREGHGQEQYQNPNQQQHRPPMPEDEFKRAVKFLRELPAVQQHNLIIEIGEHYGRKVVVLKEQDGKVVRRIQEAELWTLQIMKEPDSKKGQLLRRSA